MNLVCLADFRITRETRVSHHSMKKNVSPINKFRTFFDTPAHLHHFVQYLVCTGRYHTSYETQKKYEMTGYIRKAKRVSHSHEKTSTFIGIIGESECHVRAPASLL
jgi:hypothetical protein